MRFAVKPSLFTPLLAASALALLSGSAAAATDAPGWMVNSHSYPTNLPPGGKGVIGIDAYNVGALPSSPGAVVTDTLPEGVSAVSGEGWSCSGANPVACTYVLPTVLVGEEGGTGEGFGARELALTVSVKPGASEGESPNRVSVAGGGAPNPASASSVLTISSTQASFGFAHADAWFSNADGTLDMLAGSHPYAVTFAFDLNAEANNQPAASEEARDIEVRLPPGLIGNSTTVPRCTRQLFDEEACSASTQIGEVQTGLSSQETNGVPIKFIPLPVYNLVLPPGTPAEFGFHLFGIKTLLDAAVRSGGDYGITERVDNVAQREIVRSAVTLWGVPADSSHDAQRVGHGCSSPCKSTAPSTPFLTLPTSCVGPQTFSITSNTWTNANAKATYEFQSHDSSGLPAGVTGCDHLGFGPSITIAPDTSDADTAAGLTVELKVPQEGLLSTEGLATSNIRDTTVTLPRGLVINPGQAAGLAACQPSEDGVGSEGPPSCPNASKVGTSEIETPLLARPLKGDIYVLQSNPPDLKLLVAASGEGVNVKLVGNVHLDEATGQLTTTFNETPELPFTDFKLSFNGGAQAALATPTECASYATNADFMPWSAPATPDALLEGSFAIEHGPGSAPCPSSPLPFGPTFLAGTSTDQAGGFAALSTLLQRNDGTQRLESFRFKAPAGLAGLISTVPLCPGPQAAQGTCPSASHIGHAIVTSGPGPNPLVIPQPGQPEAAIYLTGPYRGAPFGLSIVTPVIAGPFNLGTIITRAKIAVDPNTAQVTVTSDPLPQIIDGVPTDLRSIYAVIDRPGFFFNPTNCEPQEFSGTATSAGSAATAPLSSRFDVGSCRELPFKPSFTVSTQGRTSKANGASLTVKVTQKPGEANIHKVQLQLPIALPSRLSTLQKACTEAQFNANPAGCPQASNIGTATAHTPVLSVPLSGPAYLVSHGAAAFPDVEFILQGEGVTILLDGKTDIKKGITYSRFETVPDAPISSFETNLPEGPHSALSAFGNLCAQNLVMPTTIVGQNGAQVKQSTKIAVTGCGKPSIKITKAKIKGNTVLLTVTTTQQGTVTVSGNGLKTIKKALAAGPHQLKVSLTNNGRTARKHHKKTKVKASVKDSNGSSSKTTTLKL
jgi:hypothetical protein